MPKHAEYVGEIAEAASIKRNNAVYEMKSRGIDVTVLSYGEVYFDTPLYGFDDLPYPDINYYSHSRGIPGLRKLLARFYGDEYGVSVDADQEMIVTAGSKIAIHMSLMTILNPGDEVIYREPAWVSYPAQIQLCHGVPVGVPCAERTFAFEKYITPKTKAIIINSPNNPTGWVSPKEELDYLHQLAEKHDLFLISDEAYSEFVLGDEFTSMAIGDPHKQHSIICNSLSKNHGITGWRLGYVITNPELTYQILKVNQHLITCPATILEHYMEKHFYDIAEVIRPQIQAVVQKRKAVGEYMDSVDLAYMPGTGTFYYFISIEDSALDSEEFCDRLLEDHRISTVPGIGYGRSCDKFIRISVGMQGIEEIQNGVDKIKQLLLETASPRN